MPPYNHIITEIITEMTEFVTDQFYDADAVFLFITVKLFWSNLYCKKLYIHKLVLSKIGISTWLF